MFKGTRICHADTRNCQLKGTRRKLVEAGYVKSRDVLRMHREAQKEQNGVEA